MNKIFEIRILAGKVCLILTTILVVLTSNIEAQNIEYALIRDVSMSTNETREFKTDYVFKKIISELDLKDSDKAVNLRTVICGEKRIPEINEALLPEQTSIFASASKRTNQLRQFLTKAKSDIEYLAGIPRNQQQTNLYRSLVSVITQMDSEATQKTITVISDGIEVSSVLNAKKYADNPSSIMDDYEAIKEALERDMPLPDFSGIQVVFVTPGSTDLHLWMSRFWEKLITSGGGSVTTKATF